MTKQLVVALFCLCFLSACEQIVLDANDPYERAGPYSTASAAVSIDTTSSDTNISGVLYYPQQSVAANSLPLVILLPGFSVRYYDYEIYAFHLVSHGYAVLGMDYVETSGDNTIAKHDDKAQQISEALTYVLTNSSIKEKIDNSKIAAMGHSLGGKLGFYAAAIDPRFKAVIALDPVNAGGPPCLISPDNCANYPVAPNPSRSQIGVVKNIFAASLIFRSQPDALTNPENEFNASQFYFGSDGNGANATPSPSRYIDLGPVPHANYVPKLISFTPTLVKRNTVAWLDGLFRGIDNSTYFTGAKMQEDINAGRVTGNLSR